MFFWKVKNTKYFAVGHDGFKKALQGFLCLFCTSAEEKDLFWVVQNATEKEENLVGFFAQGGYDRLPFFPEEILEKLSFYKERRKKVIAQKSELNLRHLRPG